MPHKDPTVRRAYHLEYNRKNRGRYRWYIKLYDAATHANERAERFGVPGRVTTKIIAEVLGDGCCFYCGGRHLIGVDHIKPMHAGGPNTRENMVAACRSCNASKWRGEKPWQWSQERQSCLSCNSAEREHLAKGMCPPCYRRIFGNERRRRRRAEALGKTVSHPSGPDC